MFQQMKQIIIIDHQFAANVDMKTVQVSENSRGSKWKCLFIASVMNNIQFCIFKNKNVMIK